MIEETAIMEALVMVNGKELGYRKYCQFGGHLRWVDGVDEPVLFWPEGGITKSAFAS